MKDTDDLRITALKELISPQSLTEDIQISEQAASIVDETRQSIHNLLYDKDDRLLVVVGPCSIHDTKAAMDYAERLLTLRQTYKDDLQIVMRVYFEKPRTTVGWKGLINDPNLDGSFDITKGLHLARQLLLDVNNMGMPAGTEFLDLISPQYIADLVSWGAIGARTTESQSHRELASGLSCPVGFKNATNGETQVAIDAINAANKPHHFLSVTKKGYSAIFSTSGNEDCHVILRGGKQPNYDMFAVEDTSMALIKNNVKNKIMIDASHANSRKRPERQMEVIDDIARQIAKGNHAIFGVMIESHIKAGRQDYKAGVELTYGQSITDACIDFDSTINSIEKLAQAVKQRRTLQ
ncbi:MAG: 3-deoxy-7-phosphoheptulonate synthase [Cellvibrionales bacterium]|nr:3-deoxy-7-phosphoheptulonate synthase [Cellvibrionales bacterium]